MASTWIPSKEFLERLREKPKVVPARVAPAVALVAAEPYPFDEGVHKGSRYYTTAVSPVIIDSFLKDYLSFMHQCKEMILMGRERMELGILALFITQKAVTTEEKAEAIHNWVYKYVSYQRIPEIIPPWELIKPGVNGDCKSFAVLIASLLGVLNIPSWLKLVKVNGLDTLHIYNVAKLSWEVVDGVASKMGFEIKPISGYLLFEIDKTPDWPPKPLPSDAGAELPDIPEKLKQYVPVFAIGLASLGIITLALSK